MRVLSITNQKVVAERRRPPSTSPRARERKMDVLLVDMDPQAHATLASALAAARPRGRFTISSCRRTISPPARFRVRDGLRPRSGRRRAPLPRLRAGSDGGRRGTAHGVPEAHDPPLRLRHHRLPAEPRTLTLAALRASDTILIRSRSLLLAEWRREFPSRDPAPSAGVAEGEEDTRGRHDLRSADFLRARGARRDPVVLRRSPLRDRDPPQCPAQGGGVARVGRPRLRPACARTEDYSSLASEVIRDLRSELASRALEEHVHLEKGARPGGLEPGAH